MPALDPQSLPRHLDRLYRAAWALCGSAHDAEDLVQETCARVLARPRRLHGEDELAYLMTVLRNTFLTQLRTAARRPRVGAAPVEELDPVDPRSGGRPEAALEVRETLAAIAGLPDRYRLALVAVDIVGLSYREAGVVLETREATIATRVFRARQLLARRLAPGAGEEKAARGAEAAPGTDQEGAGATASTPDAAVRNRGTGPAPATDGSTPTDGQPASAVGDPTSPAGEPARAVGGPAPPSGEPAGAVESPVPPARRPAGRASGPSREGRPAGRRLNSGGNR